jgi:hypothetical protein
MMLISLVASALLAAGSDAVNPTLADLDWIVGSWIGEQENTRIEEHWTEAVGDSMMGSFKMVKDGKPVFYEFMLFEQDDQGVTLRIKHFGPGLDGWENKDESVDFDLVSTQPGRATFETEKDGDRERLIYSEAESGELVITLEKPAKGSTSVFRFGRR